jgi:glycosyltransferase involved in cell wall biosynthesis
MQLSKFSKKIILVAAMPPAINGQAIYTGYLINFFKENNISFHSLPISEKTGKIKSFWSLLLRILEYSALTVKFILLSIGKKKIVYISPGRTRFGFLRDLPLILCSSFLKNKVILHFHAGDFNVFFDRQSPWMKKIIKFTYSKVEHIIILSNRLKTSVSISPDMSDKIIVIPNGVEPKKVLSKQIEGKKEPIKLLFLSNLIESKGYLDVLEAVKILIKEHNINVECLFCGLFIQSEDDVRTNGIDAKELFDNYVKKNNLSEFVKYHGVANEIEKEEILLKSHILILPTNYNAEAQPISILEALANGLIVISTNYRAIPDMVIDGVTGFLIPYRRPDCIAGKIKYLYENPKNYKNMSSSALNIIRSNFSIDDNLLKIYNVFEMCDN